jgi:Zn-dependent protease
MGKHCYFRGKSMNIDRIVLAFAGVVILLSVVLSHYHHPYWLFLTAFVGLNLFQSAFTGFCPLATILKKMGKQSGSAF